MGYTRLMTLTGKQRRFLRARGHHLSAVLQIGKNGITPAFVAAVDQALLDHELIKIRIGQNALVDREDAAQELARTTGGEIAQMVGSMLLLYREHPEEPVIELPRARAAGLVSSS